MKWDYIIIVIINIHEQPSHEYIKYIDTYTYPMNLNKFVSFHTQY